jgi:hypothetical protein
MIIMLTVMPMEQQLLSTTVYDNLTECTEVAISQALLVPHCVVVALYKFAVVYHNPANQCGF